MFRQLLKSVCVRPAAIIKQKTRSTASFCFDSVMPIVPPCFWSTLPNGVRVISEQTCGPLACVTLIAEAGSRYETECNNGACHFFEHMSVRGLATLTRCPFQELFRAMGAHLYIHTDREYQAFVCTCAHQDVACVMNILSRMFYELQCNSAELECAKMDVFRELLEIDSNYKKLTFDYLHQTAYQGTPLARAPVGPSSNYRRFDGGFLTAFVSQHYQPFRLVLSVSSVFTHADIVCKVQCAFGNMKCTTNDLVYWPCRYTGSYLRYRDDSIPFCHVAIAVETPGFCSPEYLTLQVMKHFLGRWDESQTQGYNTWPKIAHGSALSKLCHRYESFYLAYRDTGLWGVYFVVKKEDDIEDALLMIQDQFMSLCSMLVETDVHRAKAALKLEMAKAVDGCVATCIDMGKQMLFYGCRDNLIQLNEKVNKVDSHEIRNLADKLIYDRCPVLAAVGPTESVPEYNRIRQGMYWVRL